MNRSVLPSITTLAVPLLLLAEPKAWACNSGSLAITTLSSSPNLSFQVTGLNSAGNLTGYFYDSGLPHAFLFKDGAVSDLGTLGGMISYGTGINDAGQVVGASYITGNFGVHGFFFDGTSLLDIGTLGGGYSSASLINDAGQIAGDSYLPNFIDAAFLYSNGSMLSLGTLGGTRSTPFALNRSGQVAGESTLLNDEDVHAFVSSDGVLTDLGTLGGNYSSAFSLNDAGVVVGESTLANAENHGFIFSGGVLRDLGTLGGTYSSAFQVNSNGQVIGIANLTGDLGTNAFIYNGGTLTDIGTLGGSFSVPYNINDRGQVVGMSTMSDGTSHAFLWQNGQLVDLNSLLPADSGWVLSSAQFINHSGRIVGTGVYNALEQWFILDSPGGNNAPVAIAGADQTVDCQAQVSLDGSGSSDPDGDPLTFEWSMGGTVLGTTAKLTPSLPLGTNVLTLKVTDSCSASAQANVTVIVADKTPPSGSCPGEITAIADGTCQAAVPNLISQVVAGDNCTPVQALVITQNPQPGTLVGLGPHPITLTVTDASGNGSSCEVLFTVVDRTPPNILSTPGSLTVHADAHCQAQVPNILSSVQAVDNCTPADSLTKSQNPAAGTVLPRGNYSITVTVTDVSGNSSAANVDLAIVDATAPIIQSLVASPNVLSPPNHQMVPVTVSPLVTDDCGAAPVTKIVSIIANEVTAPGDIQITGDLTALLAASKSSSGSARIYTINIVSTDPSGNSSPSSITVSVPKSNGTSSGVVTVLKAH